MKKLAILFSACLVSIFTFAQSPNSRVLVIGIDGVRSDALTAADTPNIDALIASGLYSPNALNDDITISGPGWSNILCGVRSDKHLVEGNDFSINNYEDYPSFFSYVEGAFTDVNTVSICHWSPINDYIVMDDADVVTNTTSDEQVRDEAIDHLQNGDPHAIFLHFDDVDHAGHSYGFHPDVPQYNEAIEAVDQLVGEVVNALESRPGYDSEDWAIIVTHDHGGVGYSHGGTSIEHREVSFIVSGNSVSTDVLVATEGEVIPAPENCLGAESELWFDGGDYMNAVSPDLETMLESDFTVEIRVRTYGAADVAIVGNKDWDNGYNPGFVFSFEYPGGPAWKVNVGDGDDRADANGAVGVDDGQWHTLSASFDLDGVMKLYTDGVLDTEEDISFIGNMNVGEGMFFGADIDQEYNFTGAIGEIRIWGGVIDEATIADYACISVDSEHPNYGDLWSYWKCDETDGSDYMQNHSWNQPFLNAVSYGAEQQIPEAVTTLDYSGTPRIVDVPVTAMTHMCIDVLSEWDLDGISWVDECDNGIETYDAEFNIYPNPASSEFTINSSNQIHSVDVYNLVGELVFSQRTSSNLQKVSVDDWSLGVYFVEVNLENGTRTAQKIVIR